jgi:hypothetical protein
VEVGIEEPRSDSEYDSDVIVVENGQKCPRGPETPPNYAQPAVKMLPGPQFSPQLPSSLLPAMGTAIRNPALLE